MPSADGVDQPPRRKLDHFAVVTLLTLVIVAAWIISAVVRLWVPWPEAHILDQAMTPVIGYWFVSLAIKRNGSGSKSGATT